MQKIFMDKDEPLFNRADAIIRLQPFTIDVLKHILSEYHPQYSNDDLLALYAITGGVPKYVAWLMDNACVDQQKMYVEFSTKGAAYERTDLYHTRKRSL